MPSTLRVLASSALVASLAACGNVKDPSKRNFEKAIQAQLDTQKGACAGLPATSMPFALEQGGGFVGDARRRADALVAAGLLSAKDAEVKQRFGNRMVPGTEYQATDRGKKYLVAGGAGTIGGHDAFCTGTYKVIEVDTFTEPSDAMGVKISRANFRYRLDGAADWVKHEAVAAAYRTLAEQAKPELKGQAVLVLTNEGWMHERLFKQR